jgi:hypothetical protein
MMEVGADHDDVRRLVVPVDHRSGAIPSGAPPLVPQSRYPLAAVAKMAYGFPTTRRQLKSWATTTTTTTLLKYLGAAFIPPTREAHPQQNNHPKTANLP